MFFASVNNGYSVGSGDTIIKTTNGGTAWVKEKSKGEDFKIYPTPANGAITIEINNLTKENTLTILNISGQELIRQQIKESKTQLDINNLTSGVYFLKLITDKTVEVRKIIKE